MVTRKFVDDYEVIERTWGLVVTEVLVVCLILAVIWYVSSIRWTKRFSLGTLLIATTLVAVVLGMVIALT